MFKKKLEQLVKSRKYYRKKHPKKKYKGKRGRKPQRVEQTLQANHAANGETVIELLKSKYLLSVVVRNGQAEKRAKMLFRMFPKR